MGLLGPGDSQPVIAERIGSDSPFLFICDHAGRQTPIKTSRLGLTDAAFDTHIAWDIGAAAVTRKLSAALGSTAFYQAYSRLVIDCNRDPGALDAIPLISDGVPIPGNETLTVTDRQQRVSEIHTPYHTAIAAELDARAERDLPTILVFMHSFTPRMAEFDRPWHFGVIRETTSQFSKAVLKELRVLDSRVGDNEPYAMDGVDYSAPTHAFVRGLDYLELEMRQDLICDDQSQVAVAARLIAVLTSALAQHRWGTDRQS